MQLFRSSAFLCSFRGKICLRADESLEPRVGQRVSPSQGSPLCRNAHMDREESPKSKPSGALIRPFIASVAVLRRLAGHRGQQELMTTSRGLGPNWTWLKGCWIYRICCQGPHIPGWQDKSSEHGVHDGWAQANGQKLRLCRSASRVPSVKSYSSLSEEASEAWGCEWKKCCRDWRSRELPSGCARKVKRRRLFTGNTRHTPLELLGTTWEKTREGLGYLR